MMNKKARTPDQLVSVGEIAESLGVTVPAVSNWRARPYKKFPQAWGTWGDRFSLFDKEEIEAWLAEREAISQAAKEEEIKYLEERLAKLKGELNETE
jgi:predicted DNA-binding transcriptional regulator AlpA